jgi:hypothetical protein
MKKRIIAGIISAIPVVVVAWNYAKKTSAGTIGLCCYFRGFWNYLVVAGNVCCYGD